MIYPNGNFVDIKVPMLAEMGLDMIMANVKTGGHVSIMLKNVNSIDDAKLANNVAEFQPLLVLEFAKESEVDFFITQLWEAKKLFKSIV